HEPKKSHKNLSTKYIMKRREFISMSGLTLCASASGTVFGRSLSKLLPKVDAHINHHGDVYKSIATQVRQLLTARYGHILTNARVWSSDGKWIVYDIRSDAMGADFDGSRIERVNLETRQVQVLYQAQGKAKVGVTTYDPIHNRVVFIHGPNQPTADWQYT